MQVPERLRKLCQKPILLIVASRQNAKYYVAYQNSIDLIDEIKVENPKYSDREGHFRRRGRGLTISAGAPYESPAGIATQDFIRHFKTKTPQVWRKASAERVFLFVPSHMKHRIIDHLPKPITQAITQVIEGNYFRLPELQLLEKAEKAVLR